MSVLSFLKNLAKPKIAPEVTRKLYPKDIYGDWEFIPFDDGSVLARVYTVPLQEKRHENYEQAKAWVHKLMPQTEK